MKYLSTSKVLATIQCVRNLWNVDTDKNENWNSNEIVYTEYCVSQNEKLKLYIIYLTCNSTQYSSDIFKMK